MEEESRNPSCLLFSIGFLLPNCAETSHFLSVLFSVASVNIVLHHNPSSHIDLVHCSSPSVVVITAIAAQRSRAQNTPALEN